MCLSVLFCCLFYLFSFFSPSPLLCPFFIVPLDAGQGKQEKKSRKESKKSYKTLFFFFATFEIRVLRCARKVPLYVCVFVCVAHVCVSVCVYNAAHSK